MGMSLEDATELEEEERRRKAGGRWRIEERVQTLLEELGVTSKEAEELEKKKRRQWAVGEEREEEKDRKETQEELREATVDEGSARVEGVGEEDEAIALRLNISESNLACVRHRVDRVEDDVEVLKNRMKGMTIDRGEQVEGAQARIAEELESHDRIAARMDKRGTSTACKECGRKSVRDKFTQTPIRGTSRKFTQTPKTGEPPVRSAYKGPIWNIGQFDGANDEEEETSEEEDGSEKEEGETSSMDQEKKDGAWTVKKALTKMRSLLNIGLGFFENGIRVKNLGKEMARLIGKERATLREVMEKLLDIATDHFKNELDKQYKMSLDVAGVQMGLSALKSLVETIEEEVHGSPDGREEEDEAKSREEVSEEVAPDEMSDTGEVENTNLRDAMMEVGEKTMDTEEIAREFYTKAEKKRQFEEERDNGSDSELSRSEEDDESVGGQRKAKKSTRNLMTTKKTKRTNQEVGGARRQKRKK